MPTTPRTWYAVNVVTVKRETAAERREFQRTHTIPMQQKGGVRLRDTWQSGAPFGEGLTYAIVTSIDKFEDYDKPPLVSRVLSGDALPGDAARARRGGSAGADREVDAAHRERQPEFAPLRPGPELPGAAGFLGT